jgi:hypothetical protein
MIFPVFLLQKNFAFNNSAKSLALSCCGLLVSEPVDGHRAGIADNWLDLESGQREAPLVTILNKIDCYLVVALGCLICGGAEKPPPRQIGNKVAVGLPDMHRVMLAMHVGSKHAVKERPVSDALLLSA